MVDTLVRAPLARPVGPQHAAPTWAPIPSDASRATRRGHKQHRRRGSRFQTLFATMLIVGGLVLGGTWTWNTFGTTWLLRDQMSADIQQFSAQIPAAPTVVAAASALRTNFDTDPPPQIDMAALATAEEFGLLTVPIWEGRTGVHGGEDLRNRILLKQGGDTWAETNQILDSGAAVHYTGTAGPGDIGNFSISAHRRSYGDNFLYLPDLAIGDWILFESAENWYVYQVIGNEVVTPFQMHVVDPDPFSPVNADGTQNPTRRLITLTTCTLPNGSPWGNSHRWVVHGELYGWMPRAEGIPPMIDQYWDDAESPIHAAASGQ